MGKRARMWTSVRRWWFSAGWCGALWLVVASSAEAGQLVLVDEGTAESLKSPTERWVVYMHHVHTLTGSWAYEDLALSEAAMGVDAASYDALGEKLLAIGIEAVGVTEHNTLAHQPVLAARAASATPVLLSGTEITGSHGLGHLGLLFPPGDTGPEIVPENTFTVDGAFLENAIAEARARGALTIVNHPLLRFYP